MTLGSKCSLHQLWFPPKKWMAFKSPCFIEWNGQGFISEILDPNDQHGFLTLGPILGIDQHGGPRFSWALEYCGGAVQIVHAKPFLEKSFHRGCDQVSETQATGMHRVIGSLGEIDFTYETGVFIGLPSRELTYPTLGKGKSSSKVIFDGIC